MFTNLSEPGSISVSFQWTGSTTDGFQGAFRAEKCAEMFAGNYAGKHEARGRRDVRSDVEGNMKQHEARGKRNVQSNVEMCRVMCREM